MKQTSNCCHGRQVYQKTRYFLLHRLSGIESNVLHISIENDNSFSLFSPFLCVSSSAYFNNNSDILSSLLFFSFKFCGPICYVPKLLFLFLSIISFLNHIDIITNVLCRYGSDMVGYIFV